MPTDDLARILGPRQTILVSSRAEKTPLGVTRSVDDLYPTDHHSMVSAEPFLYSVVLPKGSSIAGTIRTSQVFCVNFVSQRFAGIMHDLLTKNADFQDKFHLLGLAKEDCKHIDAPFLGEAAAVLEAEVVNAEEHGQSEIFIGRILEQKLLRDDFRPFHLSGGRFTSTDANR